jgi:hypothetical protein
MSAIITTVIEVVPLNQMKLSVSPEKCGLRCWFRAASEASYGS